MKPVVVIGTESFAELLFFYLKHYSERKVTAFSVHERYLKREHDMFCEITDHSL